MVTKSGRVEGWDRLGVWDWHAHIAVCKIKCLSMGKKKKTFGERKYGKEHHCQMGSILHLSDGSILRFSENGSPGHILYIGSSGSRHKLSRTTGTDGGVQTHARDAPALPPSWPPNWLASLFRWVSAENSSENKPLMLYLVKKKQHEDGRKK